MGPVPRIDIFGVAELAFPDGPNSSSDLEHSKDLLRSDIEQVVRVCQKGPAAGRRSEVESCCGVPPQTPQTWTPATVSSTATVSDSGSIRTYKAKVPLNAADKKFLRLKITALTN